MSVNTFELIKSLPLSLYVQLTFGVTEKGAYFAELTQHDELFDPINDWTSEAPTLEEAILKLTRLFRESGGLLKAGEAFHIGDSE